MPGEENGRLSRRHPGHPLVVIVLLVLDQRKEIKVSFWVAGKYLFQCLKVNFKAIYNADLRYIIVWEIWSKTMGNWAAI